MRKMGAAGACSPINSDSTYRIFWIKGAAVQRPLRLSKRARAIFRARYCGEENTVGKRILGMLRRDTVLTASLCLAVLSCLIVPPSRDYLTYIDYNTLIILFCLMLIVEGLRRQNFLQYIAERLLSGVGSARQLVLTLVMLCFVSSMFMTNDVALLTFVPLGMMLVSMSQLEARMCLTVTLMTIAANLGSMFTPIGNPQNLYLYGLSGLTLSQFLKLTGPYVGVSALLLILSVLLGCPKSRLSIGMGEPIALNWRAIGFYLLLFLLCVLSVAGFVPHLLLLAVVSAALLWRDRDLFAQVDYTLILTFVFFFVFVGNLKQLDQFQEWIGAAVSGREKLLGVLVSQVISNVPAAMLLSGYSGSIPALIVGTNLGGLGTLIASMASLISYKQVANHCPRKKGSYLLIFTLFNLCYLLILYWI